MVDLGPRSGGCTHLTCLCFQITRVMAGYQRCVSLALVCLLLCHDSLAAKSTACAKYQLKESSHAEFNKYHLCDPSNFPKWWKSVENRGPKQSCINSIWMQKVYDVCNSKGGLQYTGPKGSPTNLCISKKKFSFFTLNRNNMMGEALYDIEKEFQHLILACDKVGNKCLPTHFEPYGKGKFNTKAQGCGITKLE